MDNDVVIISIPTIDQLLPSLTFNSKVFTLFIAWDAESEELPDFEEQCRPLIEKGIIYFCVWGKNCELLHDTFDRYRVSVKEEAARFSQPVMTTWHNKESLESAFWFYYNVAFPNQIDRWSPFPRYVVLVGNAEWEKKISKFIAKFKRGEIIYKLKKIFLPWVL